MDDYETNARGAERRPLRRGVTKTYSDYRNSMAALSGCLRRDAGVYLVVALAVAVMVLAVAVVVDASLVTTKITVHLLK